jgi:hypothetical protein
MGGGGGVGGGRSERGCCMVSGWCCIAVVGAEEGPVIRSVRVGWLKRVTHVTILGAASHPITCHAVNADGGEGAAHPRNTGPQPPNPTARVTAKKVV